MADKNNPPPQNYIRPKDQRPEHAMIDTQDYIEEFETSHSGGDEVVESENEDNSSDIIRDRAHVPSGPNDHDKRLPPSVAQGD